MPTWRAGAPCRTWAGQKKHAQPFIRRLNNFRPPWGSTIPTLKQRGSSLNLNSRAGSASSKLIGDARFFKLSWRRSLLVFDIESEGNFNGTLYSKEMIL